MKDTLHLLNKVVTRNLWLPYKPGDVFFWAFLKKKANNQMDPLEHVGLHCSSTAVDMI